MPFLSSTHRSQRFTRPYSVSPNVDPTGRPTKFKPYLEALNRISARTRTPFSSLVFSFAILHELTAIIPLVGFFLGAKYAGVGDQLVHMVRHDTHAENAESEIIQAQNSQRDSGGWVREKLSTYIDEGEKWAGRVGRRYGWWGYEKGAPPNSVPKSELEERLAGDIANAVAAYALTKAILPLRVGISLWLSPSVSRGLVEPCRRFIVGKGSQLFRKRHI